MTNQKQIRAAFWVAHPGYAHQAREAGVLTKGQNYHCATVRCAFVDYVDMLCRNGEISESLARRVML